LGKIHQIIEALRHDRFEWTPVKRVYIPKKNGKLRPLGLPTWTDKLVQESIRLILESYYEPQFSDCSFGFRPNRGCQSALNRIANTWTGTAWFIEGDIAGCFDNIDHEVLLKTLRDKIHDDRFVLLIAKLLKAGAGIILISSYLPEVYDISDTLHVFRRGRLVSSHVGEKAVHETILTEAIGV